MLQLGLGFFLHSLCLISLAFILVYFVVCYQKEAIFEGDDEMP